MSVAWQFEEHLSSRKAPIIAEGRLFVGTFDDKASFVSLDAATGKEIWRTDLGTSSEVRFNTSAAAIAGDLVICSFGRVLFAFDNETGEVIWRESYDAEPLAPVTVDDVGYMTLGRSGTAIAFDTSTGNAVWRRNIGQSSPGAIAASNGTVYALANGDSEKGSLVALDAATGDERWRYRTEQRLSGSPAVEDGTVYVSDARGVHAVTTAGNRHWRFLGRPIENQEWQGRGSSPAVRDGSVYIGTADERVYALDAKSGQQEWEFWTWNNVTGTPVVTPDTVYVGSDDTIIYAFNIETGERRWEFDTTGSIDGAGGAVVDGRLYISTFSDGLYALEEA